MLHVAVHLFLYRTGVMRAWHVLQAKASVEFSDLFFNGTIKYNDQCFIIIVIVITISSISVSISISIRIIIIIISSSSSCSSSNVVVVVVVVVLLLWWWWSVAFVADS